MIEVKHLSKHFGGVKAVDDLSFKVETGKVTGFLGPNGAGKSTTMRLMLGLDHGGGSTTFDGQPLQTYARPSQMVGILLEAKAFHPTRSPRQHLKILAEGGQIPLSRVDEVLEEVGLTSVAKKAPGKFSLGMAQRLGIAAALLGDPKYLLLDEPANGLDPEGIVWLRDFLKAYAGRGNGVFVSSHLLSEMSQLADNVVVIGRGRLIADTSMAKLLNQNAKSGVTVRVDGASAFEKALTKQKLDYQKAAQGAYTINKVTTDEVGRLAFKAKVAVLELASQTASLEDVFLELTAGSAEFVGQKQSESELPQSGRLSKAKALIGRQRSSK